MRPRPRTSGPAAALLAACLAGALVPGCDRQSPPPNIVLVVLDTTRADALGCYGNPHPVSPRIDALAAEGVLFERAFSTDFWTLPSHASLFTGLHPSEHGATTETNQLSLKAVTLAEVLAAKGYATGGFVANPWVGVERGFSQGFGHFSETWRDRPPGVSHRLDPGAVEDAERWIGEQVAAGRPFFAFLNLNGAHLPYDPDPVVHAELYPRPHQLARVGQLKQLRGMWAHLAGALPLDDEDYEILRELYHAEVAMLDTLVGRLVDRLGRLGVADDTLMVVTADHGENIGDHGRIDHMLSMYDSTLHVPLILRYPARLGRGERRSDLASLVDVFPTVLELLGQADPDQARRSLFHLGRTPAGYVLAENERPRNGVELLRREHPDFDASAIDERMRMVRTPGYKLIWREKNGVELYDLKSDPGEQRNVASEQRQERERLLGLLERWDAERAPTPGVPRLESADEETLEQLRALGYAE